MNLLDRAKNIVLSPKKEWKVINTESTDIAELYKSYIIPLAAIGPVSSIIGLSFVGIRGFRVPIGSAITHAIISYALSLIAVFIVALIIDALAPTFSGRKNTIQALKVATYSYTPAWLAGVFVLIPWLGVLGLLAALYGLYVLYLGLPVLMEAPKGKALVYTVVVVVCTIVILVIIGLISSAFISAPTPEINIPLPQGIGK